MGALRVDPAEIRQNRYAVVIGINRYRDPAIPDLGYARADAEAVYRVLSDPQFGRIPEENVILLLDEAATQREIRKAVGTTLKQKAGEEDVVYIYYAGHGSPEIDPNSKSSDGLEKYLVPHDGEAEDLFSSAISMEEIRRFFQRLIAKQVIFFLDSCYSGEAGGRTFPDPRYRARSLSGEFLEHLGGEGRLVITACHVNEVSLELNNLQHGLFTYHLLEGMRGKADRDEDGLVSIDELYQYLYRNVSGEARRLGGSMRPMRKGSVVGDIYITQYQTAAQKEAERLRPRAREETKGGNLENAALSWRNILKLLPDDEEARKFLSAIEKKQQEAQEKKQRLLERRQGVLLDYYHRGELSAEAFGRAMELLPREKASLSETEQRIHKLLADLADGKISLLVYRSSITLIDKGLAETPKAAPEEKPPPASEPPPREETAAATEEQQAGSTEAPKWEPPRRKEEPPKPPTSPRKWLWITLAGVALTIFVIGYIFWPSPDTQPGMTGSKQPESSSQSLSDISSRLQQADRLRTSGALSNLLEAKAIYQQIIDDNPDHSEATQKRIEVLQEIAQNYYKNSAWTEPPSRNTVDVCKEILNYDPQNDYALNKIDEIEAYYLRKGNQARNSRQYDAALSYYQKAYDIRSKKEIENKIAETETEKTRYTQQLTSSKPAKTETAKKQQPVSVGMVHIPGGTFRMGSTEGDSDEQPVHEVYVSDFYMSKYEVTFGEYDRFCEATGRTKPDDEGWGRGNRPVINVSWYDAVEYCNWRSRQENLTPCYSGSGNSITCNFNADGYRLPTEAEWEFAARGGLKSAGYKYSGSDNADEVAWYGYETSGKQTHPVGEKKTNELGLYDMTGNVWEWCWDWYDNKYYEQRVKQSPKGSSEGSYRVLRGGSWFNKPTYVRAAIRYYLNPDLRSSPVGFRISRTF